MDYEDRIAVSTPEGIDISYTLAGLGSRLLAMLLDLLLKIGVFLAVFVICDQVSDTLAGIAVIVGGFLAVFVYDVVFEVWGTGRTPGKRANGLRVVTEDGRPVRIAASAVRRLLWLIDVPVTLGIVGTVSILSSSRAQRLGDIAAGTVVVRDGDRSITAVTAGSYVAPGSTTVTAGSYVPPGSTTVTAGSYVPPGSTTVTAGSYVPPGSTTVTAGSYVPPGSAPPPVAASVPPPLWATGHDAAAVAPVESPGLDVTAVSAAELAAVRDFLNRRSQLGSGVRLRIAQQLAEALTPRVGGLPPEGVAPEQLIELIAAAKR